LQRDRGGNRPPSTAMIGPWALNDTILAGVFLPFNPWRQGE